MPATLDYAGRPDPAERPPPRYYVTRVVCCVLGIAYPLAGLILNAAPGDNTVPVDWQNGRPWAWVTLVTLPRVGWVQWPLLGFAWLCLLACAVFPRDANRSWLRRLGLWVGIFLGLEYLWIVSVGLADGDPGQLHRALPWQILALLGSPIILSLGMLGDLLLRSLRRVKAIHLAVAGGVAGVLLLVVALAGVSVLAIPLGVALAGVLIAAPLSVAGHGGMLWLLGRPAFTVDVDDAAARDRAADLRLSLLVSGVLLPLHGFGWLFMWHAAKRAYLDLPPTQPDYCFVATAASRSRRSAATRHRQLRTLRAFESWLRARRPRAHRTIRRHYNVVGPALARRINTPRRADVAHRALSPAERLARVVLQAH